jgi:hypothetical protein
MACRAARAGSKKEATEVAAQGMEEMERLFSRGCGVGGALWGWGGCLLCDASACHNLLLLHAALLLPPQLALEAATPPPLAPAQVIDELKEVAKALRKLPTVDAALPTLALIGAPNAGKSSLVQVRPTAPAAEWRCCCDSAEWSGHAPSAVLVLMVPARCCWLLRFPPRCYHSRVQKQRSALPFLLPCPPCAAERLLPPWPLTQHAVLTAHPRLAPLDLCCAGAVIRHTPGLQLPLHNPQHQDGPLLHRRRQAPGGRRRAGVTAPLPCCSGPAPGPSPRLPPLPLASHPCPGKR